MKKIGERSVYRSEVGLKALLSSRKIDTHDPSVVDEQVKFVVPIARKGLTIRVKGGKGEGRILCPNNINEGRHRIEVGDVQGDDFSAALFAFALEVVNDLLLCSLSPLLGTNSYASK